jgi:hypothetical protein
MTAGDAAAVGDAFAGATGGKTGVDRPEGLASTLGTTTAGEACVDGTTTGDAVVSDGLATPVTALGDAAAGDVMTDVADVGEADGVEIVSVAAADVETPALAAFAPFAALAEFAAVVAAGAAVGVFLLELRPHAASVTIASNPTTR